MKFFDVGLKFGLLSYVLTNFRWFANCGSISSQNGECYDGCTCQTWFGYPACTASYWYPNSCKCCQGYKMKNHQCIDINECEENEGLCDSVCVNTIGSYECRCKTGYIYNKNKQRCLPAGPCFMEAHFCQHICIPLGVYRYRCECHPGYILASDRISCKQINTGPW